MTNYDRKRAGTCTQKVEYYSLWVNKKNHFLIYIHRIFLMVPYFHTESKEAAFIVFSMAFLVTILAYALHCLTSNRVCL